MKYKKQWYLQNQNVEWWLTGVGGGGDEKLLFNGIDFQSHKKKMVYRPKLYNNMHMVSNTILYYIIKNIREHISCCMF